MNTRKNPKSTTTIIKKTNTQTSKSSKKTQSTSKIENNRRKFEDNLFDQILDLARNTDKILESQQLVPSKISKIVDKDINNNRSPVKRKKQTKGPEMMFKKRSRTVIGVEDRKKKL